MKNVEIIELTYLADSRGWVARPLPDAILNNGLIANFHVPSLKPGAVRGNHYHRDTREYVLILNGPCKACFKDTETGELWETVFPGDRPVLLKIEPHTTHTFMNAAPHDVFLICYDEIVNKTSAPDIYRDIILE